MLAYSKALSCQPCDPVTLRVTHRLRTVDSYSQCSRPACFAGQVYKGILRATGESVAVKVQRPGIGDHIAVDMLLLRRLMAVIDKNQTIVSIWDVVQPF